MIVHYFLSFAQVNFLVSKNFNGETRAMVMTILGVSQVIGKVAVALVGDHLPFPKIFLLVIANIIGAILMGCLLVAESFITIVSVTISKSKSFVLKKIKNIASED